MKALLTPMKAWRAPTATLTKRVLLIELLIVMFLTLGKNAIYSLLKLISYVTEPGVGLTGVSSKEVTMSGIYSKQAWYDIALHLADFTFSVIPVLLVAWLLHNSGQNVKELWASAKGRPAQWVRSSDFLRGAGMAAFVGTLGIGLYLTSHYLGLAATIKVGDSLDTWRYWAFLLLDSLGTSILEEFVVVGYVLVRLCQLGMKTPVALALAALFRGSYHLYQGLWGLVGNFFMGLAFGYLYLRWGRIMPLVIAHFIMDGAAFMALALLAPQLGWLPN